MSASSSEDAAKAAANQEGEFGSHVPRSEPLTTHGHQPGREPGPPEHHIETLPAGTAPASRTFQPQNESEVPGQALNPDATQRTGPLDGPGSTSADVSTGLGHPGQGQSSQELHHDGKAHRDRQGKGLTGVGATVGSFDQESSGGKRVPLDGVDK